MLITSKFVLNTVNGLPVFDLSPKRNRLVEKEEDEEEKKTRLAADH